MVIETIGIADPGPVLHTLVMSDLVAPDYRMDGVVTLADAASGPATPDRQFEAVHQIAVADVIVLTKADLVSAPDLHAFETRLDGINGTAPRIRADHGRALLGELFGLSAPRRDVTQENVTTWMGGINVAQAHAHRRNHHEGRSHDAHHPCGHDHSRHDHHHHDTRMASASIEVARPIPASVFDFWLDMLIALKSPDLLRMKGIIHVEGIDWPLVFHGVQHIFDPPLPLKSWQGGDTTSRMVVIARDITKDELVSSLNVLRMQPKAVETSVDDLAVEPCEMPF